MVGFLRLAGLMDLNPRRYHMSLDSSYLSRERLFSYGESRLSAPSSSCMITWLGGFQYRGSSRPLLDSWEISMQLTFHLYTCDEHLLHVLHSLLFIRLISYLASQSGGIPMEGDPYYAPLCTESPVSRFRRRFYQQFNSSLSVYQWVPAQLYLNLSRPLTSGTLSLNP